MERRRTEKHNSLFELTGLGMGNGAAQRRAITDHKSV
jgi:hypothetical protein